MVDVLEGSTMLFTHFPLVLGSGIRWINNDVSTLFTVLTWVERGVGADGLRSNFIFTIIISIGEGVVDL